MKADLIFLEVEDWLLYEVFWIDAFLISTRKCCRQVLLVKNIIRTQLLWVITHWKGISPDPKISCFTFIGIVSIYNLKYLKKKKTIARWCIKYVSFILFQDIIVDSNTPKPKRFTRLSLCGEIIAYCGDTPSLKTTNCHLDRDDNWCFNKM